MVATQRTSRSILKNARVSEIVKSVLNIFRLHCNTKHSKQKYEAEEGKAKLHPPYSTHEGLNLKQKSVSFKTSSRILST